MANRYLRASGNWNGPVWAATSGGAAGSASTPTADDDVYIAANYTVTLTADAECRFLSHTNGTINFGGYKFMASSISSTGTIARTLNLGSSEITLSVSGGAINFFGSGLTLDAGDSIVIINADTGYGELNTLSKTFNDVIINLGQLSISTDFYITGSPTFRSLIIQSKNSAAHTVNFEDGSTVFVSKFVAIGSSSSNKLSLETGGMGYMNIDFADGGTSYGQYVQIMGTSGPYPGFVMPTGNIPFYIGSNSALNPNLAPGDVDWLLQDPPKISTLVDPLTTAPESNGNWSTPTYSGAGLPTLTNTGYEGGGYDFGNKDGVVSVDTYDLLDSDIIVELVYQARSDSNNFRLDIGFIAEDGSNSEIYTGIRLNVTSVGSNVGYSTVFYPIYAFAEPMIFITSFSSGRRFFKYRIDSSTGIVSCSVSSDGLSWDSPASAATPLSQTNMDMLRSSRMAMSTQYNGSGVTVTTIGSINPSLKPKNTGNFLAFFTP